MASKELQFAKFINIHSHAASQQSEEISDIFTLRSLILGKLSSPPPAFYSCGVHPWFLGQDSLKETLEGLEVFISAKECLLIGETGLDFSKPELLDQKGKQLEFFKAHINLSEKYKKPLIIHCVKAFDEILNLHKTYKPTMPWIMHDFNASLEQIKKASVLNFYFSLGPTFLRNNSKIHTLAKYLDLDRVFIETDELEDGMIYELYKQYAILSEHTLDDICVAIKNNFMKIIGDNR